MAKYKEFCEITKELLDSVEVGDVVRMNDWKRGMVVRGVTANYFVMATMMFGEWLYSVCEKKPSKINYNMMTRGMFHIGRDSWVFGFGEYKFDDKEWVDQYLNSFEDENCENHSELSVRGSVPIDYMSIRKKPSLRAEMEKHNANDNR